MRTSRRDLLTLVLGAPLAAAACSRPWPFGDPPLPDGELLDFGRPRAHALLRDAAPPTVSADAPIRRASVVIVGGGVAGLSAAWRLRRAGVSDFLLVELDDALGGTSQSGSTPVTAFPWGAHYTVLPFADNRAFTLLLGELGALEERGDEPAAKETQGCREPEERHFYQGRFHLGLYPRAGETAEEAAEALRFQKELNALAASVDEEGRRAFDLPTARCSTAARFRDLDKMSFAAWLDERGFHSWRLRWLCDYACRDDYGLRPEDTSAWAGLFYFCARRRPERGEAGSHEVNSRPVITWPEGNGRIVAHLARSCQSRRLTGHAVVDVDPQAALVALTAVGDQGPVRVLAEDVVLACPRFVAGRVLRPWRQDRPAFLDAFTTSPWAVVNLHLRGRPRSEGVPFAWDTVFTESKSLGYVTATHQSGGDRGPTVLTWYRPLVEADDKEARERLLAIDREGWAEAALSELEVAHPDIRSLVTRVDVGRFGHAMLRPTPGLFSSGALEEAARPVGRVSFAHTDLSGVPLCEEAFFHGVRAAEEVLRRQKGTVESIL